MRLAFYLLPSRLSMPLPPGVFARDHFMLWPFAGFRSGAHAAAVATRKREPMVPEFRCERLVRGPQANTISRTAPPRRLPGLWAKVRALTRGGWSGATRPRPR